MPDELDRQLLRRFAYSREPLDDPRFAAAIATQLLRQQRARWTPGTARDIGAVIVNALINGVRAPLQLPYARLLMLAASALTLWAATQGL